MELPASRFLRPYHPRLRALDPLRLRRITAELRQAAHRGLDFHLWWHPHNFGAHLSENLGFLERILDVVDDARRREGMVSMTMAERAGTVQGVGGQPRDLPLSRPGALSPPDGARAPGATTPTG